jgi:hypothetical protein
MKWIPFNQQLWGKQKLPPERRYVLLMFDGSENHGGSPSVAVGYLRYAAGDKNSPNFITPGYGNIPSFWCDCLGDDFSAPLWE